MLAVPSFESSRKKDIVNVFGVVLQHIHPLAEQGLLGMLAFSCLVALWDGISVVPARYAEFMTALCYRTVPEYVTVMILGKTMGGYLTYKFCSALIKNEELEEVILNNGCSFYVSAISDLVRDYPIIYGLIFRMFFPSIMNCIALALLPLNQTQFIFIQFLHALILSWPQAVFDYFPYIEKKLKLLEDLISSSEENEHADIIRRGIDSRMDFYRLCFVLSQIAALCFIFVSVLRRNSLLQRRFVARIKLRLIQLNLKRQQAEATNPSSNSAKPGKKAIEHASNSETAEADTIVLTLNDVDLSHSSALKEAVSVIETDSDDESDQQQVEQPDTEALGRQGDSQLVIDSLSSHDGSSSGSEEQGDPLFDQLLVEEEHKSTPAHKMSKYAALNREVEEEIAKERILAQEKGSRQSEGEIGNYGGVANEAERDDPSSEGTEEDEEGDEEESGDTEGDIKTIFQQPLPKPKAEFEVKPISMSEILENAWQEVKKAQESKKMMLSQDQIVPLLPEDKVDRSKIDFVLQKKMLHYFNPAPLDPAEVKKGNILSQEEKMLWRFVYSEMLGKTKQEWESRKSNMQQLQFVCFVRLELAGQRAGLDQIKACKLLMETQKGALLGMARFLWSFHNLKHEGRTIQVVNQVVKGPMSGKVEVVSERLASFTPPLVPNQASSFPDPPSVEDIERERALLKKESAERLRLKALQDKQAKSQGEVPVSTGGTPMTPSKDCATPKTAIESLQKNQLPKGLGKIKPGDQQLIVRVIDNKLNIHKLDSMGQLQELTAQELRMLKPTLHRVDAKGNKKSSMPVTSGSLIPGQNVVLKHASSNQSTTHVVALANNIVAQVTSDGVLSKATKRDPLPANQFSLPDSTPQPMKLGQKMPSSAPQRIDPAKVTTFNKGPTSIAYPKATKPKPTQPMEQKQSLQMPSSAPTRIASAGQASAAVQQLSEPKRLKVVNQGNGKTKLVPEEDSQRTQS